MTMPARLSGTAEIRRRHLAYRIAIRRKILPKESVDMFKKISVLKGQISAIVFLFVVVLSKTLVVMFRKGTPSVEAIVFAVLMCAFFVVLFFLDFPTKREEIFTGQNIFRIVAALVVFIGAFAMFYVNAAFNMVMMLMPVILFCSSDFKLVPISVVASFAVLVSYEPFAFTVIPGAILVLLTLVAPKLKEAKQWEKIVFSGALISLTVCLVYVIYQMRFIFSFPSLKGQISKTVPMLIIAVVFVVCAVFSLKTVKRSNHKNKKKKNNYSVKEKKADYLAGFTYLGAAVYAVASAMLEGKYVMCCLVSLLTAMFVICKDGTQLRLISDKVANAAYGLVGKIEDTEETE